MGIGGISVWQLAIILAIAVLVFGTSRLKNLGSDLGGAIKGFRKAMDNDDGADRSRPGAVEPGRLAGGRGPSSPASPSSPESTTASRGR